MEIRAQQLELSDCILFCQPPEHFSHTCLSHCRHQCAILHSAGSAQDHACPWLHSYAKCILVGPQSYKVQQMQQRQSAQHLPEDRHYYSIILRRCCQQAWPFPWACVSATQDKQAACSTFLLFLPASVYHLFSISLLYLPFFKSICGAEKYPLASWSLLLELVRFCYLFQGAGQKQPARDSIKPRGGVLQGS